MELTIICRGWPQKGFSFFGRKIKSTEKAISFSGRKRKIKNCYCPRLWNRPHRFSASVALSMMLYKFHCDYDYDLQISVTTWNSKCTKSIYFLINPWSQAHTSTNYIAHCINRSVCKLQYLKSNSRILYSRNNNFSAFSPSKLLRQSE